MQAPAFLCKKKPDNPLIHQILLHFFKFFFRDFPFCIPFPQNVEAFVFPLMRPEFAHFFDACHYQKNHEHKDDKLGNHAD